MDGTPQYTDKGSCETTALASDSGSAFSSEVLRSAYEKHPRYCQNIRGAKLA